MCNLLKRNCIRVILGCHHAYTLAIVMDFKGNDNNLAEIKKSK
jgi:hypothetical protein